MQIAGKTFVVTGGGSGIGREVVLELTRRGARVAAVGRNADKLAETAALAAVPANMLTTHSIDVVDRGAVLQLPDKVIAAHGGVDGVLNIAGVIQPFRNVVDLGFDEIERVMNVNYWGVVNMTKAFLPHLLKRKESALVNVSSMGGLVPFPGQAVYGASKAAVKLFTEALAVELRGTPVTVTAVFPGGVDTDIAGNSNVELPEGAERARAWYRPAAAEAAGRQIVRGLERGSARILIGMDVKIVDRLARLAPRPTAMLIAKVMKALLRF